MKFTGTTFKPLKENTSTMATLNNNSGNQNNNAGNNRSRNNEHRPDVRDNLDSRGDLELNDEPTGHNEKELHIGKKNEHNDPQGGPSKKH